MYRDDVGPLPIGGGGAGSAPSKYATESQSYFTAIVYNVSICYCVPVIVRMKKEPLLGKKDKMLNCNIIADCICSSSVR